MKLLSKREVKELTLYSDAHRGRLEKVGLFPMRVRLGKGRYCRVGYVETEIVEWIAAKIAARDKHPRTF